MQVEKEGILTALAHQAGDIKDIAATIKGS